MKRLEVSGAVRPIYGSLGVKRLVSILLLLITVVTTVTVSAVTWLVTIVMRFNPLVLYSNIMPLNIILHNTHIC